MNWTECNVTLGELVPWERNPKRISKASAKRLLDFWTRIGQFQTVAIGPGSEVYDGHQRLSVLLAAFGKSYTVKALRAERALTEAEREELFAQAHYGTVGQLNWDMLAGFDTTLLEGAGFDADLLKTLNDDAANLALMLTAETEAPPEGAPPSIDRAEELQEKWQVQTGDIFQAGEHFVICGDCREPETWARLLKAAGVEKVNGVFTSPPYAEQRKEQYGGVPTEEYVEWWEAVQANVRENLAADGSFFVNIKPHCEDGERVLYVFDLVLAMKRRWGWRYVDESIWKHGGTPGRPYARFKNQFEPIYQFSIGEHKFIPDNAKFESDGYFPPAGRGNVSRSQGTGGSTLDGVKTERGLVYPGNVFSTGKNQDAEGRAAAFPVALPAFFVKAYSDVGDVWLDPFCGSGTVLVSCQNEGRIGLGIERLEKYVAVILERLSQLNLQPVKVNNAD